MINNNHSFFIEKRADSLSLDGLFRYDFFDTEDISFDSLRYETQLPSSAYKSVFESGLLPHYYTDDNSKLYRNLRDKVFCYEKRFYVPAEKADKQAFLCFDGADYKTEIILNGHHLGEHIGICGGPYLPITDILRFGDENELRILAKSPAFGIENYDAHNRDGKSDRLIGWGLAGDAECSNGNFCVHGITGSIRIEFLSKVHISRPFLFTERIGEGEALLHLSAELTRENFDETAVNRGYDAKESFIYALNKGALKQSTGRSLRLSVSMTDMDGEVQVFDFDIAQTDFTRSMLEPDRRECQYIEKDILLRAPRLWYPHSLGEPHLYNTTIKLYHEDTLLDTHTFNFGIREIKNRFTAAEKFFYDLEPYQFSINGEDIFLRGINMMPQDFLYDVDDKKTERILRLVREANITLIRLWGAGGKYESNHFYELCDRMGIMVWQDSIIANMTTGNWDVRLFDTLTAPNIYRLRNHPSLAIWCGGNEFNPYHTDTAACLGRLRQTLSNLDPTRIFFDTTPLGGSAHVYQNIEPTCYRKLYKEIPFMGESGIHSFPCSFSLKKSISLDELETKVDKLSFNFQKSHPKFMCHFVENNAERVPQMLTRASQLGDIENGSIQTVCLLTQLAAYELYQIMGEAMIENYPKTAGHMPWVLSRGWNTISAQIIDAMEGATLQYYAVKKTFSDLHAFLSLDEITYAPGESLPLRPVVVSHKNGFKGRSRCKVTVYSPALLPAYEAHCDLQISEYKTEAALPDFVIPKEYTDSFFFIVLSLVCADGTTVRNYYRPKCLSELADSAFREDFRNGQEPNFFFEDRRTLAMQIKDLTTRISAKCERIAEHQYLLTLKNEGAVPALPVVIEGDSTPLYPSDNALLLTAGETVTLSLRTTEKDTLRIHGFNFEAIVLPIE